MADTAPGRNWAGNHAYRARRLHEPGSLDEVREIVRSGGRLHVLGSRHSFHDIADTDGELISLDAVPPDFELAADRRSVTVGAAARYGEVARFLADHGLTLRNFASLPHISVAGATATGTHGSGDRNRCLAADVLAFEVLTASGETRRCSRETLGTDFAGAVVGLGALGVVTRVTLAVVAAFDVRQDVFESLPWPAFEQHLDEITARAYSVSMFTDFGASGIGHVWLKSRVGVDGPPPPDLFGARLAPAPVHPIPGMDPAFATEQLGAPGPAHERLPHFRLGFTPSNGDELQTEYLVDRRHAVAAVRAVRGLSSELAPLLQIAELRTVAADDLWLSPSCGRPSLGLHFTWVPRPPDVAELVDKLEAALQPFDPRPHWGKVFAADARGLLRAYPLLPRFTELARGFDPDGRFRNAFLDRVLS